MKSSSSSSLANTAGKSCFIEEEDDGLASLAEMEAEFSGNDLNGVVLSHLRFTRRNSLRNLCYYNYVPSPRSVVCGGFSGRFHDSRFECNNNHQPHFLDSCYLCKKPLGDNRDIFMYRGDIPFCSEECRQEQIERDEARDKKHNLSSSMKAMRRKEQRKSSSPTKSQDYPVRTGTLAAA